MPTTTASVRARAYLMLALATVFWGVSFPLIKAAMLLHGRLDPSAGSLFLTAWVLGPRFLAALAIVALLQAAPGRGGWMPTRREAAQGVTVGLYAAAGMLLQNDGLRSTAASTSAFLTQLYALLIPLWLALRTRRNPGWVVWSAAGLVTAGVAILGRFDLRHAGFGLGEWETLAGSVFFMAQILRLDRRADAGNRPLAMTLAMMATESAVFTGLALWTAPAGLHSLAVPLASPAWLGMNAALAVVCTVGAFLLMNFFQPRVTPTEAGLIYCLEPLFSSVFALFMPAMLSVACAIAYGNERATGTLLLGGALITVANVLIQVRPPPA